MSTTVPQSFFTVDYVQRFYATLIGRPATAKTAPAAPIDPRRPGVVAEYHATDGPLAGVLWADVGFAAATGAALVLLPPGAAAQAIKANKLDELLRENFAEVANVASRLFTSGQAPRVKLGTLTWLPGNLPPEVAAFVRGPGHTQDLDVQIAGYGGGRVSLFIR